MTKLTLLFRNLRYFLGVNLAVLLGMAVATAVLTGALMVGDSVRGSLADLAKRRLGPVDYALISTRFFPQSLADDLGPDVVPGIIVRGAAINRSASGPDVAAAILGAGEPPTSPRTADVQIAALGGGQAGRPPFDFQGFPPDSDQCLINGELARELKVTANGAKIEFIVPTDSDVPRDAAVAQRRSSDLRSSLIPAVTRIVSDEDFLSLFTPAGSQRVQRNSWVNLLDLQQQIHPDDRLHRVNVLLAHEKDPKASPQDAAKALTDRIDSIARAANSTKTDGLSIYGLSLREVGDQEACVFADDTYLAPPAVTAAQTAAKKLNIRLREVSVNLVTSVTNLSGAPGAGEKPKVIHYVVAAGISSLDEGTLGDNEIAINQWTAEHLGAKPGDRLQIDFYLRKSGGELGDASKDLPSDRLTFTVKYVLPMSGLGADPLLPPVYKGLTDVDSPQHWADIPGLKIDRKLVTKEDEKYWNNKKYRTAPKVFLSFQTAQKLWGGVYGGVTGLRVSRDNAEAFKREFLNTLKPEAMGLIFRPIKAEQLAAAAGGTDFGDFFLMFSFFLIVAAALLVAMLFRLNVEQRARQLGVLSAAGFSPASLRRMALGEGMILAALGAIIGLGGAIGYTSLIMYGLRSPKWWLGAVGTTAMTLHVEPMTLVYGFAGSLFVAFFAILWAVWRVGRAQPARLLSGGWGINIRRRGDGQWVRWIGIGALVIGLVIVALSLKDKISVEAGFGGGAVLLFGCLAWLGADLRPRRHSGVSFAGAGSLIRLGIRNATRHTARGVLSVGLIGFAAFTLITVAAVKQEGVKNPRDPHSETGGYSLILTAGIPLTTDLNTVEGRIIDGMDKKAAADPIFSGVHFTMLRQWAGQDISCLNLTKPTSPTILGVPPEMIERGAFVPKEQKDIWKHLLDEYKSEDIIPVIADSDTAEYVLQMDVGGTIPITDQLSIPRNLKLAATIAHSIFQGQLLMSDANFRKLFPAQNGFTVALIDMPADAPSGRELEVAQHLSSALADYSVSVDTTTARLETYQKVQNTYLETFQTLGALGLMLGTLGLAVVLVRTVIERKAELALLASLGFASASRVKLVLSENVFLLMLGLALGALSAVIGILPAVLREARPINILSLATTLGIVLVVGLFSSALAVALSGVHVGPADLRRE